MSLDHGSISRVQICHRKMYRAVCKDRLEKACLMDLFLIMDANSSNSVTMALSGPNFSFGSIAKRLFRIN